MKKNILQRLEKYIDKFDDARANEFGCNSLEDEYCGRIMGLQLAMNIIEEEFGKARDGE